jgi:hypothetical protein
MQEDRDIAKFDYITYMERYMGGKPKNGEAGVQVNGGG